MEVRTDERRTYAVAPDELWRHLVAIDRYATWWPWLREFDGAALATGATWRCTVRPPLPYRVRFTITFDEVEPGRSATATIGRDLTGTASLAVAETPAGSELRLRACLTPSRTLLRAVATVAHPVARFGHDWVIGTGFRRFEEALQ